MATQPRRGALAPAEDLTGPPPLAVREVRGDATPGRS